MSNRFRLLAKNMICKFPSLRLFALLMDMKCVFLFAFHITFYFSLLDNFDTFVLVIVLSSTHAIQLIIILSSRILLSWQSDR